MDRVLFERIYDTVARKEATYDGIYYTAVRSTHIVCRPSCRARTPKPENVTFYPTLADAIAAGFRPCKRCKPEEGGRLNPDALLAGRVDALINAHYAEKLTLAWLSEQLRISPYHLQRMYKRLRGITPAQQLDQTRLSHAKEWLAASKRPVAEVGEACGFRSPSHFAVWFTSHTGITPTLYRNRSQCPKGDDNR